MQARIAGQSAVAEARARTRAGWTGGRVVSVVVGGVLALCSLAALGGGGVLAVGGVELGLGAHGRYHTPGYALVRTAPTGELSCSAPWNRSAFEPLRRAPSRSSSASPGRRLCAATCTASATPPCTRTATQSHTRDSAENPTRRRRRLDGAEQRHGHPDAALERRWRGTGRSRDERRRLAVGERPGRLLDRHPADDAHARCRSAGRRSDPRRDLNRAHRRPCQTSTVPAVRTTATDWR